MKRIFSVVLLMAACALPFTVLADCPGDCVETCSAGPAEDYVLCLHKCLKGCNPAPVPPVPAPTPVPAPKPAPKAPEK